MKILVLNGSPKGENSVTMSYVKYLKIVFPEHVVVVKHVAQSIHRLEKDCGSFDELMNEVRQCVVILWAFTGLDLIKTHWLHSISTALIFICFKV